MVFEYKYDFELSTKRQIFLSLYQFLPNIDIIKHIYQFKEELELDEIRIYHGLCPKGVQTTRTWNRINKNVLYEKIKLSTQLIKYIVEPGFMCEYNFDEKDYNEVELNEIRYGNWISVISNINFNPSLCTKIRSFNKLYNNIPFCQYLFFKQIEKIYEYYKCTYGINIYRISIVNNNLKIPYIIK